MYCPVCEKQDSFTFSCLYLLSERGTLLLTFVSGVRGGGMKREIHETHGGFRNSISKKFRLVQPALPHNLYCKSNLHYRHACLLRENKDCSWELTGCIPWLYSFQMLLLHSMLWSLAWGLLTITYLKTCGESVANLGLNPS